MTGGISWGGAGEAVPMPAWEEVRGAKETWDPWEVGPLVETAAWVCSADLGVGAGAGDITTDPPLGCSLREKGRREDAGRYP